jgi:hypothetical protein
MGANASGSFAATNMIPGTEYDTGRRLNGKIIYQKCIARPRQSTSVSGPFILESMALSFGTLEQITDFGGIWCVGTACFRMPNHRFDDTSTLGQAYVEANTVSSTIDFKMYTGSTGSYVLYFSYFLWAEYSKV